MRNRLDQSKASVNNKKPLKPIKETDEPWDSAIEEAKRRIARLRFSIKEFKKRKARGDKWLGAA